MKHEKHEKKLPFVLFLDVDKTLIGRANHAVNRFWLIRVINELIESEELSSLTHLRDHVIPSDLIRPGVVQGLQALRDAHDGDLEIFICSLGTAEVVHNCKLPTLLKHVFDEKRTGLALNRPIFCASSDFTENCRSAANIPGHPEKKAVKSCFLRAMDALRKKKKWKAVLSEAGAAERVFEDRFIMIDDTMDVASDDASNQRMLVCPPYEYTPWESLTAGLPAAALKHPKVQAYLRDSGGDKDCGDNDKRSVLHQKKIKSADDFWSTVQFV